MEQGGQGRGIIQGGPQNFIQPGNVFMVTHVEPGENPSLVLSHLDNGNRTGYVMQVRWVCGVFVPPRPSENLPGVPRKQPPPGNPPPKRDGFLLGRSGRVCIIEPSPAESGSGGGRSRSGGVVRGNGACSTTPG